MDKNKKLVYLTGRVLSLKSGECALIRCGGEYIRTSKVVTVLKTNDGSTLFETINSFYCVTAPDPVTPEACVALPMCA